MEDEWEVSPSSVTIEDPLGEGAFGEVYKGLLKGPLTNSKLKPAYRNMVIVSVAIKLLKGKHNLKKPVKNIPFL